MHLNVATRATFQKSMRAHSAIRRQQIADESPTNRRPIADESPINFRRVGTLIWPTNLAAPNKYESTLTGTADN